MNATSAVRSNHPTRGFSAFSPLTPEFHTPTPKGQPLRGGGVRSLGESKELLAKLTFPLNFFLW